MIISLFALMACRPDPIEYPYNTTTTLDTGSEEVDLFAGPDPYEDGESRLSLGVFYESGYSDIIPVDEESSFSTFGSLKTHLCPPSVKRQPQIEWRATSQMKLRQDSMAGLAVG